jgi:CHAD domain-containing protein
MAGNLHPDEPGTRGARRIARKRVKSALKLIDRQRPTDHSVHAARKELKKARATLRLVRDALGHSAYKKENAALRDAARPLGEVRDAQILRDALKSLVGHYGAPVSKLPLAEFRRVLDHRHQESRAAVLGRPGPLKRARKTLRAVRARSERWQVGRHGWSVLGPGLKRTYSQGKRAFGQAKVRRSSERLHEWRKQIQYFSHQLQLFAPLEAGPLAVLSARTHQLADFLGDDHDLAVLREQALEVREVFPTAAARRELIALIDKCRGKLQNKALRLGQSLYKEKPAAFTGRLERYWRGWGHAAQQKNAS